VFTARYALSHIKEILFLFKGLINTIPLHIRRNEEVGDLHTFVSSATPVSALCLRNILKLTVLCILNFKHSEDGISQSAILVS
jgi:hypothetical protein